MSKVANYGLIILTLIVVKNGINPGPVEMKGFRYSPNDVGEDTDIWVLALLIV